MLNCIEYSLLHILYAPGSAGNHLKNLLATSNIFNNHLNNDPYKSNILELYRNKSALETNENKNLLTNDFNVHFEATSNKLYEMFEKTYDSKIDILLNHKDRYDHNFANVKFKDIFFKNLKRSFAIIVECPKNENSRAFKRLNHFRKNHGFNYDLTYKGYTLPFICGGYEIFNKNNAFLISSEEFMSDNGAEYVHNFAKHNLGIELDNCIFELHEIWCKMVDKSIE